MCFNTKKEHGTELCTRKMGAEKARGWLSMIGEDTEA